jgi:hypothetical protein
VNHIVEGGVEGVEEKSRVTESPRPEACCSREKSITRVAVVATLIVATACSPSPPTPPLSPAEQAAAAARRPPPVIPPDIADGDFSSPLPPSDAEQILSATGIFDIAGEGRRLGRQVQAFNVLLDQPDAPDRFRRLGLKGGPPGQLYALCGLLLVARTEGLTFAHSLSLKPGDVAVRDGDFTFDTQTVRAIVLVFADELPRRLRERRAEVYAYFSSR